MLKGAEAAGAKTVAVEQGFHVIHDRLAGITRAQEVAVERVYTVFVWHRLLGGIQRLVVHLSTERLSSPGSTLAAESSFLVFLQIQQIAEVFKRRIIHLLPI